jgi:exopolysaccharide biosynthesis polyprenyl glycosylphosphotransferase
LSTREGDGLRPRRSLWARAAIWKTGRILAVVVPVVAVVFAVPGHAWHERIGAAVVLSVIWVGSVALGQALTGPSLKALGPEMATLRGVLIAVAASAVAWAVWLPGERLSLPATCLLVLLVFILAGAWELFAVRMLKPAMRLLLVGEVAEAETLMQDLPSGGPYALTGFVDATESDDPDPQALRLGHLSQLASVIVQQQPDVVILTAGSRTEATISRLLDAAEAGFRILTLAEFHEYAFGRVPVDDLSYEWFMSVLHLYQRPYSRLIKRALDLTAASALLVLTLPLFPLLALFVRKTEGPVIFRQTRLGEHGRLFTLYKFRTMCADAEQYGAAVWASADDPRLTQEGALMRRFRLDELPQLWNVLRGEMSLVGPRPERPEFRAELTDRVPYWWRRHLIKPGLTGWAQVCQGYTASAEETADKLSYDLWYVRHRSLTVDLAIMLRTVGVVVQGATVARRYKAPATNADPYAELRERALTALGSGVANVVPIQAPSHGQDTALGLEAQTMRSVGESGH